MLKKLIPFALASFIQTSYAEPLSVFIPVEDTQTRGPNQEVVVKINPSIFQQSEGTELKLNIPELDSPKFIVSKIKRGLNSIDLVGHIKGDPDEIQSLIINRSGSVYGEIRVNDQVYEVNSKQVNHLKKLDKQATPEIGDDSVLPPAQPRSIKSRTLADPSSTDMATINVYFVISPGIVTWKGANLQTYLDYIVSATNLSLANSNIYVQFQNVGTRNTDYADSVTLSTALNDIGQNIGQFSDLESVRTQTGADVVVFLRKYVTGGSMCGVGYLLGYEGSLEGQGRYAYSVVELGSAGGYSCPDSTLSHELGHNLGNVHDVAHAGGKPGIFAFSYGYGINTIFGDIMSYYYPRILKFSNPDVICKLSYPCGVADQADVARSTNLVRFEAAAWQ